MDLWLCLVLAPCLPSHGMNCLSQSHLLFWDFASLECNLRQRLFVMWNSISRIDCIASNFLIPHHSRSICRLFQRFSRSFDLCLARWWLLQMQDSVFMAHKQHTRRDEMTERAQIRVGYSDHHYCALKAAPDPLWDQYKAEEEVVRTEMTDKLVLSLEWWPEHVGSASLHIWECHICAGQMLTVLRLYLCTVVAQDKWH